mgnify:CR=1 FL=1
MSLTTIEGIVSGLERTNQVTGGGDTIVSTTQITIFTLAGERVLLTTKSPAMIAEGDRVKLAGVRGQGEFAAIACRNLTTGWTPPCRNQGCAMAILAAFGLVGVVFTLMVPIFIFMPIFSIVLIILMIRADSRTRTAHRMLGD